MAEPAHITPNPPQQPDLRAYVVYDQLPAGCIAYALPDSSCAPLMRTGEFVVIDTTQTEPEYGELFLEQMNSGSRRVIETWSREFRFCPKGGGAPYDGIGWLTAAFNRAKTRDEVLARMDRGQAVGWFDGPWKVETMRNRLVGKVVGILESASSEPRKLEVL